MILRRAWLLLLSFLPLASAAQSPEGVPLAAESHHHLSMQNDSVAVYQFELAPHAATPLHHHDKDYISIAIGGALVTRAVPGQPEAQRKLVAGEISFARGAFTHALRNDGDTPLRNVTIELLQPQGKLHNRCQQVAAGEPLDCPSASEASGPAVTQIDRPAFETEQTRVLLVTLLPRQQARLGDPHGDELIVTLDSTELGFASGKGPERKLKAGEALWFGRGGVVRVLKNRSERDVRYVLLILQQVAAQN